MLAKIMQYVKLPKFAKEEKDRFSDLEVKKIGDAAAKGIPWADTF